VVWRKFILISANFDIGAITTAFDSPT